MTDSFHDCQQINNQLRLMHMWSSRSLSALACSIASHCAPSQEGLALQCTSWQRSNAVQCCQLHLERLLPRWAHVMPAVKLRDEQIGGLILTRPHVVIYIGCTD